MQYLLNRQIDSFKNNDTSDYYHQEVELEFRIGHDGRPTDIKVLNKPDKVIAEKAIEILQNGAKWKSKKKK